MKKILSIKKFFSLAAAGLLPCILPAAMKTATWTLPADWEAQVEYGECNGRLAISGPDFGFPSEPAGAPALPFLSVSIPVASGSALSNCTVEAAWTPVETALRPAITQQPHVIGEEPIETPEDPQYFGAVRYPANPESLGGVQTFLGEATIQAWVTPYRWNGQTGKLEKATALKLTFAYDAPRATLKLTASAANDGYTGVMYIISPPNFVNLWQTYVDYRTNTHPHVAFKIVNTQTEIYNVAAYDGTDDAQRIHKYLEARYAEAKAAKKTMYAILGAGCSKGAYDRAREIPIRNNVAAGSMYYASDLYYSCMETKGGKQVWDYNGDGVFLGYKKSGGGYACDTAAQVDWTPEIACFRFPVRETGTIIGIASKNKVSYSAKEQIDGLVAKLRRVEGGNYGGNFKVGVSGKKSFSAWNRGSTSDLVAGECGFFDWQTNPWSAGHTTNVDDWEYATRYDVKQYVASGRPLAQAFCGASDNGTGANIYGNDLDMDIHVSHGQKQTAAPFEAYNFFTTTKIQKILNFSFSCQTGHLDMGDFDGNGNLCFAEACVLNPKGGAIVTMNNTREGWGAASDYHEILSMLIQVSMSEAFFSLSDGTAADAFIKGHNRILSRSGNINPGSTMAGCYVEMNTMGDPLATLCNINAAGTFGPNVNGWFLKNATATGNVTFGGASGSLNLTVAPATAGETVTIGGGSTYKVFNKVTASNAHLKWNAPGGFGRNGIAFAGARGNITCEGTASRYFGTRFANVGDVLVTGYNTTFDFDRTGATRDLKSLKYLGTGTIGQCNYLRSREGGIFPKSFSIPVVNGTLVLQTTNVGGSGAAEDTKTPIFALTNAVLQISENPHWANEMLNRPVWMNGATIKVAYQSFGFGAKVASAPGMDLWVQGGEGNTVSGTYDAELNGPFRVKVESNAVIKVHVPLTKSSYAGSLVKTGAGRLELRAANTFTGGVTLREGKTVFGKEALTSSACGEVTVERGATLQIEALPLASVTKLTVKDGGILILPGAATTASYQLVDPLVGSLNFAAGALVYNVNDLAHPLKGNTTSDGYYMDTSSFLHWQDRNGTWANGASGTQWLKGGTEAVDYANGNSVMFPNHAANVLEITADGALDPGYITFNNTATAYAFRNTAAKISTENLYTVGETSFEPDLSVGAKTVVTAGKTTVRNLTTASVSVAPEGALQVTGTLSPATYIKSVVINVTAYQGEYNFILGGNRYMGYQFNGIRFFADGKALAIPAGTTVAVTGSFNGKSTSGNATVQGVDTSGKILGYSGTAAVANILDGSASTGWGGANPGPSSLLTAMPSCTVTITFGSPIRMFSSYAVAGGDLAARSPKSWTLKVTESGSGTQTQVDSRTASIGANSWWTSGSISYSGASSAAVTVADGGKLYLNGTYGAPVTVGAGATLSVTNAAKLTANKGFTMKGNVTLDVREAAKSGWMPVLTGANLDAAAISRFVLNSEDAAAKIENKTLYVATQGVRRGPYERSVSGTWNWDADDWTGNGVAFGANWSSVITRNADDAIVTANNSSTGTLACAVICNAIRFTNETENAQTVRVNGSGAVSCGTLDFSGLKGEITWEPNLNGANVIAGTNRVILLNGNGGTASVVPNGYVSTVGTFASYDIARESRMHFAKSPRELNMSQLPPLGVLSFDGMTVQSGVQGAFQKQDVTFLVEDGQSLTLTDTTGFNARCKASFDVRGGAVTVNPGGAWWFGLNGVTKYEQTGGTVTVNATGTTVGGSSSGVLFGYDGEASFRFDVNVAGGRFEIPNGIANVWNPTAINIFTNGTFKAKGVGAKSGATGTVNVNEQATLEVGSVGLTAAGMTYNLYGGTVAGFETGAKIDAPVALGGAGTLAAAAGTALYVNGAVKADGATLNFGVAGKYEGAVRLAALPEGVTNYTVSAGTWDIGSLRPTNAVLTKLDGTVAAELTDGELRQAAKGGLKLIATTLPAEAVAGRVAVVTSSGTAVPATGSVKDGALTLIVDYVYPLYATVEIGSESEEVRSVDFASLKWTDRIGMPFNGAWTDVTEAVLSNALGGVSVAVTPDFTRTLTVVNSGALTLTGTGTIATLDDSASTGETRINLSTGDVKAGRDTVIERIGTGTLTLGGGMCATMWNGVDWPTARISGFSGTSKIRYAGDTTLTGLKYTADGAGVVSYAQKVDMATETLQFNNTLTREFEDGIDMRVKRISMGNPSGSPTQTFRQTGGRIEAVSAEDMMANPTGAAPLLFAHWPGTVNYYLTGGELIATNGVTGSAYFGRDGIPCLYVGGGEKQAVMRVNRFINDERAPGKDKTGSAVELRPNGRLEVGGLGFTLTKNAELRMSGGTFLAYESAAMSSAKFTLTAGTTSVLAAANGKTLTVNTVPTGTGALVCGDGENGGTVILKGGSWENVTLGGTFEIWLTATQEAATKNVALFAPAAGYDATKVTVRSSAGGVPSGVVCEYGGKVTFVPSSAFQLPIVGEVCTNNTPWHLIGWHDSSATPRAFDPLNLPNYSDVVLEVRSNATVSCDMTQTLPSLRIVGPGAVDFVKSGSSTLTISSAQVLTDVTATNGAVKFTLADIAAGATLAPTGGEYVGNVTGGGTVACHGFCPTYANLTDASKWTGTAKFIVANAALNDLDFSRMGNGSSAVELSGTMTGGYPKNTDATVGKLVVSGAVTFSNGYSANVYNFGALAGSGSLTHNSTQTYKMKFATAEDFAGSLATKGMQIGIGANATLAAKTIAVAAKAQIAEGKTWSADNGIGVQSGGELGVAFRANGSAASPSAVTVAAGGFLNLIQNAPTEQTYKVTSGTLTLNGGVKVNGVAITSDQYVRNGGTITLGSATRTWNGGAEGVWNTTASCWRDASGADAAWHDGFAGGNVAQFGNVAAVTLAEPVAPALIDLAVPTATRTHEGYVPTTATAFFENVNLADVTSVAGDMYGNYISTKGAATPCFVTRTAGQIGVQFQKRDNELKCVKVVLTQDGANVKAQAVWAAYTNGAEPGTTNFESANHNGTVVTSDDGKGYGIKNLTLTTCGNGELTVRAAQFFAAPVTVTNGTLRLAAGEMTQDLTLGANARLDLMAEAYAVTNVITSGTLTGATLEKVTVNGEVLSAEEWTLDGNRLIRDTSTWITVGGGETATIPAGIDGKTAQVFVDAAGGTLAVDRVARLNAMAVIGGGLTLKVTGDGMLYATNGIYADTVTLDASGLDGTALAKCAVHGVPYSRWLVRGAPLPTFAEVRLPEMPKHYTVVCETLDGVGVRLVVTAPSTAMFGTFGINVHNGTALDKAATASGLYPLAHALWENLKAEANKAVSVSNVTFTIGGNASGWGAGDAVDAIQKQYMDDNGNGERTIALTGLGDVGPYRLIVYFSTDSGNIKFCPMRVNGVWYSGSTNATISDVKQDWGETGPQGGSLAVCEGVNALVSDVMTADAATLGFERVNAGVARATPCAVQVVKVGDFVAAGTDYTATLNEEEHYYVNFSKIPWNGGIAFTNGANNTVTLTASGYVPIVMDKTVEARELKIVGGEEPAYVSFETGDIGLADALAGVAAFDFGGAATVYSSVDFGSRITALPAWYFELTSAYEGPLKAGYSFAGSGNRIEGATFAGTKSSMCGSGTLTGDFDLTGGGEYSFGYDSDYAASGNMMLGATAGKVDVCGGATVSVPHLRFLNSQDTANHVELNVFGELNVTSTSTTPDVWSERGNYRGILFGHWHGTGAYNVCADEWNTGRLVGEAAYLELVYTAERQELNVTGGVVRVRGISAGNTNGVITLSNGGRLELAEGFFGAAVKQRYGEGTVSAYSYGGSAGWTNAQAVSFGNTTIDANGLALGFTGDITCNGPIAIDDTSAGKGGKVTFGAGLSGKGAAVTVRAGTLELQPGTTLGSVAFGEGAKIDIASVPTGETEVVIMRTADGIAGKPEAGKNLKAAGWTLSVSKDGKTLKAVKPGTMFFIVGNAKSRHDGLRA